MLAAVVKSQALRCRWVVADEAFGGNPAFWMGWRGWACGILPKCPTPRGSGKSARPPTSRRGVGADAARSGSAWWRAAPEARTVLGVAAALPAEAWTRQTIKEGSQGPMVAEFAALRVVAVRDALPGPDVWLVLRRHVETGELKTYLCNAPIDTALETLVRMSGMRWPIETCFEDSKQLLGMGDYEVRSWTGWHHHMTLVILAHFFVVRMSLRLKKKPRQ